MTLAELQAAGAVQRGLGTDDFGTACPDAGNGCFNLYAVSIPGVLPAESMTWFQAVAIARNSGKRLPTNQEWQAAAFGTPDGPPCMVGAFVVTPGATGTPGCVSDLGAFDMVGNVYEWVADWVARATAFPGWGTFSDDVMALAGASTGSGPGALLRGGQVGSAAQAGPLAVTALTTPQEAFPAVGFRGAR